MANSFLRIARSFHVGRLQEISMMGTPTFDASGSLAAFTQSANAMADG
jgi:hypothetical protein